MSSCSCSQVLEVQYDENGVKRNTRIVPPDLWGYYFLDLPSHHTIDEEEVEELKEEVRNMISKDDKKSVMKKLCLIDDVQRLGVGYHFEAEIENELAKLFNDDGNYDRDDLSVVSLRFRLLRQEGYQISSDVFKRFLNKDEKFKASLANDVVGMLSLYEASYLAIHGEPILDQALAFTTAHLQSIVNNDHHQVAIDQLLADQIRHALKQSIRRNIPVLEAIYCIDLFSKDSSKNQKLLKMAKLEFNKLQIQYQKELRSLTEWWKKVDGATKFPYARGRLVETFFWILAIVWEPHNAHSRIIATKITSCFTVTDDSYDSYSTFQELLLFTDAFLQWDNNKIDHLPQNLKHLFQLFFEIVEEERHHLEKEGTSENVDYGLNELKKLIKTYFLEAKWLNEEYLPTLEEYVENGFMSCCYAAIEAWAISGMGKFATKEVMEWSSPLNNDDNNHYPAIIKASGIICRLMDDIVSHQAERNRNHIPSSVECCMNQYGVTREKAVEMIQKMIEDAWKDSNQAFLKPTAVPAAILNVVLNNSRVMDVLYKDCDSFTNPRMMKHLVDLVLLQPFSM